MDSAKQNTDIFNNAGQIKVLSNVLRTNISACSSVGPGYISQLSQIYMDLLTLYRAIGVIVSQNVSEQGKMHYLYYILKHTKDGCIYKESWPSKRLKFVVYEQ